MNPLHLTLRGFKGIRAGLGKDEIAVDLRMPGQLVALVGPNGAGKTTILDNLHPYRVMPSRATGYAPGSFSYFDHCYLADSKKVLVWEHDGTVYESTILIKASGKTTKQECYLARVSGDTAQPARLPDGTTSDGKTKTYDALVEHILGTPEMFFTAAFSCQGRRTLADYTNGDIKALMSELLGLGGILALGEQANEEQRARRARLEGMRQRVQRAAQVEREHEEAELGAIAAEQTVNTCRANEALARDALSVADQRLLEARTNAAGFAETERRRSSLQMQIGQRQAELEKAASDMSLAAAAEIAKVNDAIAKTRQEKSEAEAQAKRLEDQIFDLNRQLSDRDAIEAAQAALPALEAKVDAQRKKVTAEERAAIVFNDAAKAVETAAAVLKLVEHGGKALAETCEGVRSRACLADQVPCQGTDLQGRCQLLANAMEAKADLPKLEAELTAKREERATAFSQWETAKATLLSLVAPTVAASRDALDAMEHEYRRTAALAAKAGEQDALEARVADKKAALEEARHRIFGMAAMIVSQESQVEGIRAQNEMNVTVFKAGREAEIQVLRDELAAL
ncbi:MAG: hypothetical protein K2Y51_26195, partial [Gammaproteobacteria bacterium]|nr:hypothetical protein [Gammaproteobacteria bacterium]